jgi:hypothetical protein
MNFTIESSGNEPLPQEAMRRIVEAVDTYRGHDQVFVVFQARHPFEIDSVHLTQAGAEGRVGAASNLSYIGPIGPLDGSPAVVIKKKVGCLLGPVRGAVRTVVLLDAQDQEVARYTVSRDRTRDANSDIEALFFTASGIDKFVIPYLTRVFGVEYAAARRKEWIR